MNYDWVSKQVLKSDHAEAVRCILAQHDQELWMMATPLREALKAIAEHGDGLARAVAELALREETCGE